VVEVRFNHGVWQTGCPFCGSAQHAAETVRLFYCAVCMNHDVGNRTVPAKWPRNAAAVEEQLGRRPFPRQRNWEPGETIRDLKREDEEVRRGFIHNA
jgi:protein-arginine kinase activator protein McsA